MRPPLCRLSHTNPLPHQLISSCCKTTSTSAACNLHQSRAPSRANGSEGPSNDDRQADRDLFFSVLSASTTKRDAKSYLSRFKPSTSAAAAAPNSPTRLADPIHVALVKIREPQSLHNATLTGVAQTLTLLKRLGLVSIVVVDCTQQDDCVQTPSLRITAIQQADRLVTAIQKNNAVRARRLDYVLGVAPDAPEPLSSVPVFGSVSVQQADILHRTLASGIIPIIPPVAYTKDIQRARDVQPDDVLLALTRQFVGPQWAEDENGLQQPPIIQTATPTATLPGAFAINVDRIIVLDPLGGLPSAARPDKAHIFINLEQEYRDIEQELRTGYQELWQTDLGRSNATDSELSDSSAVSQPAEIAGAALAADPRHARLSVDQVDVPRANERHIQNLSLLQRSLSLLPSSSSALLTTPFEAATFRPEQTSSAADLGVGTRRPRNPLIFNLLTDKPLISPSLPVSRLQTNSGSNYIQTGQATFVKRGMSLTMIPDPRHEAWVPPRGDRDGLSLVDPRIDFGRLLNLIEDSFNRPLNVEHFLKRIRNRIAGIIVAGEYEGGALLTWELPPGVPDDDSDESRRRMVPYLDKFAVLKRSQGGGGVADIVFSAMVRSCFPEGVCWRSRKNNPVNKWYFERSVGTLKLPETNWSMFWTTDGLFEDRQKLLDYEAVCRSVQPSWADEKQAD